MIQKGSTKSIDVPTVLVIFDVNYKILTYG